MPMFNLETYLYKKQKMLERKFFFEKITWFEKYLDSIDESDLDLDYFLISYVAEYYFVTNDTTAKEEIEEFVGWLMISSRDKQRNLALAWFFESHAFDNISKTKLFYNKLSKEAQKVIDGINNFRDGFIA